MIDHKDWEKENEWETKWWGDCLNTYLEEEKQYKYAAAMGLPLCLSEGHAYFDLKGKSVVDIGGGSSSLLLKCINRGNCTVVDPLPIPNWCKVRYKEANIIFRQEQAEVQVLPTPIFDEAWIYNCLQHVENPHQIIKNARKWAKLIRIFEWINTPYHVGHPQTLREKELNKWLDGEGKVKSLKETEGQHFTQAYYGVFPTPLYEK